MILSLKIHAQTKSRGRKRRTIRYNLLYWVEMLGIFVNYHCHPRGGESQTRIAGDLVNFYFIVPFKTFFKISLLGILIYRIHLIRPFWMQISKGTVRATWSWDCQYCLCLLIIHTCRRTPHNGKNITTPTHPVPGTSRILLGKPCSKYIHRHQFSFGSIVRKTTKGRRTCWGFRGISQFIHYS